MWSSDGTSSLEDLIRGAEPMSRATLSFREQVLAHAAQARRRSESVQRVQTLTSILLVAAVFAFLPGYYQRVQNGVSMDPAMTSNNGYSLATIDVAAEYGSFSRTSLASLAVLQPLKSTDAFEWNLVEAELAVKDHGTRAFGGAL